MLQNIKEATTKDFVASNSDKNINADDEYKILLEDLKDLKKDVENPAFVYHNPKDKKMDDFYLTNKKDLLKALLQRAQILSPQQYTKSSWVNFIGHMKQSMQLARGGNAHIEALNKAINLMYRALIGLRYNPLGKKEFKNFKKSLPNDDILKQKNLEQDKNNKKLILDDNVKENMPKSTVDLLDVQI